MGGVGGVGDWAWDTENGCVLFERAFVAEMALLGGALLLFLVGEGNDTTGESAPGSYSGSSGPGALVPPLSFPMEEAKNPSSKRSIMAATVECLGWSTSSYSYTRGGSRGLSGSYI